MCACNRVLLAILTISPLFFVTMTPLAGSISESTPAMNGIKQEVAVLYEKITSVPSPTKNLSHLSHPAQKALIQGVISV